MKRYTGRIGLALLALGLTVGWGLAQGPSGYTKIATVTAPTLTYSDTTCADGTGCQYTVTAVNAIGESVPSNITPVQVISATGSWKVVLTWQAPTTGGAVVSFNVYRQVVLAPGPPSGCTAQVVAGP